MVLPRLAVVPPWFTLVANDWSALLAGAPERVLLEVPQPLELDGAVVVVLFPQVPEEFELRDEEPKEEEELREEELNEEERPPEKPPLLPPPPEPRAKLSAGHTMASESRDAATTRDMERNEGNMAIY